MSIKRELSEKVNVSKETIMMIPSFSHRTRTQKTLRGKYDGHQASRSALDRRTSDELDAMISRYVDNGVQHHLEAAAGRSVRLLSMQARLAKPNMRHAVSERGEQLSKLKRYC